jgi:3-hydroxybutyryl-CoA dehydrogenase
MNILIVGDEINFNECQAKFGQTHHYKRIATHQNDLNLLPNRDLIFDFSTDDNSGRIERYSDNALAVFLNVSKSDLKKMAKAKQPETGCLLIGFCGMPTFLNRPVLEISLADAADLPRIQKICRQLQSDFLIVEDKVGLVTPRVICMIINEAYYTLEEGIASRNDIDLAMKLGTNYPYGPFEWCERIGIKHVYELLEAVHRDTQDERYKICALLTQEYLNHIK